LEIIHRFPYNEALKTYAKDLMVALMNLLSQDNEENAVICLKIIVDLHKNYTALMEDQVQPFLDLVKEIYHNMPVAVANSFGDGVKNLY
jgi:transformation/transcription domain-associated protein